jgi:hypothetical protein
LAGHDLREVGERFEMDYWGVSCREGLEYLVRHDKSPQIRVHAATEPGVDNAMLLPADQRDRLLFTSDPADADYEVTHFRGTKADPPGSDFYSVRLDKARLMAVQKLH